MSETELQVNALINDLREDIHEEVKNWLNGLASAADKARLAKEIIALANAGGGFVFIGFHDQEPHHPIAPEDGEAEAFTQDNIASIVAAYVTPQCQCAVRIVSQAGGAINHPVIVVPGGHRTPVFARRGAPDNEILENGKVYVRRPGGNSEHAREQDDWEKLIDRLVRARQTDQLDAIRQILNPPEPRADDDQNEALEQWINESYASWRAKLEDLDDDDPRRLRSGFWYVAYEIKDFENIDVIELRQQLDRQMPAYSGWPPFTFLHRDGVRPQPHGDVIEAWLGNDEVLTPDADFWRVSTSGFAFMVRGMQEDEEGYGGQIMPGPPQRVFDWVLPIYRMTEVLQHLRVLAELNNCQRSRFNLHVSYVNTAGRQLWRRGGGFYLGPTAPTNQAMLTSKLSGEISAIAFNINELVWQLLRPIYAQFDFTELDRGLVDRVVADVHDFRVRFG